MSSNAANKATLEERVKRWLVNGAADDLLDTGSVDDIKGELRAWIDRRFRNYDDTKALRVRSQTQSREMVEGFMSGRHIAPQEMHRLLAASDDGMQRSKVRGPVALPCRWLVLTAGQDLEAEQIVQDAEAKFLCESLRVKHGVRWEDLSNGSTPSDHDVVGALMALGQPDVNLKTLHDLQDVENEEALRRSARQINASVLEMRQFAQSRP